MPLVRLRVRNEYAQGQPELNAGKDDHDPKAVLDGHAVAGLVGILRQLGDLAEFAAEVFHGLQEQVMTTASRSHKLTLRMQHIEAALPPLEKVVLAQTSHIHFAYTPGSEWHPRIRSERNHFIYNDLPQFIMDSYEECRGPPRLHLLDKFDIGGPGSCLKRYSDPTFFKKVSARADEANIEKAQRDRKARRNKKKRQSKEHVDVSLGASVSNARNYSVQHIPPIVDGRSSPSQTASSVDTGRKYDLGDNLHSFDSRADSGYIECIFHPSSSVQEEEQETKDSPPFKPVPHTDALDSAFLDEHVQYVDDNFHRSSVQEQPTSASSCVTWDEKAEIMEPNIDEALYAQQNMYVVDAHDHNHGSGNSQITDQMEIYGGENACETVSSTIGVDEIESDPDNFMDALNTIDSESENDRDYLGKQDLERFYSISNNDEIGGLDDHPVGSASHSDSLNTDLPSSDFPKTLSSDNSCVEEIPSHLSNSCSPQSRSTQSQASEQTPEIKEFCTDHSAPVTGTADVLHCSEPESVSANPLDSAMEAADTSDLSGDKAATILRASEESLNDTVVNGSVRIWTNGGLLGLAPSKPPDFMSSPMARDYVSNTQDMEDGTMKPSEGSSTSTTYLDSIHGNSGTVLQNGTVTREVPPVASNVNHGSMENENTSLVFGLSRRLLSNSLSRRLSDISDAKFEQAASVNGNGGNANQIVPETLFMEQFRYESALSATASPPLQHMKISFHPEDGLEEASKLKLKFSDGTQSRESSRDMFPSFQLIPDASIGQHDYGSDSDDDTFCRSSPFMSDDCLSRHSESNSEQWECGDGTEEGKDYEIYDALCGISSMELVPRSLDSAIGPILDLPSYDAVKPELWQKTGKDTDKEGQTFIADPSVTLPPLPPMEWRVSKPHSDVMEAADSMSESFKHELGVKLVPKQATEEKQHTNEAPVIDPKSQQEQRKVNKEKKFSNDNNTSNDFLQQIRAKSFNLRPITMAKPSSASGSAVNINVNAFSEKTNALRQAPTYPSGASLNVNAILEKANAIRQAVASDDGEDDNWSDT